MTDAELLAQKRTQLEQINTAITAVLTGAQEHVLDTGQTRTSVTLPDLKTLTAERARLEEDIRVLESRACGAVANIVPGY